MTFQELEKIVANIQYKKWYIEVFANPAYTVRATWFDSCVVTGKMEIQHSREWYMPAVDLTEDAVIQTVFKCIQNAEEHETKERFKYKGKRVFNPHVSINDLLEVCENVKV